MEKTNAIKVLPSAGDNVEISSGEFTTATSDTFYGNVMAAIKLRQ